VKLTGGQAASIEKVKDFFFNFTLLAAKPPVSYPDKKIYPVNITGGLAARIVKIQKKNSGELTGAQAASNVIRIKKNTRLTLLAAWSPVMFRKKTQNRSKLFAAF